MEAVLLQAAGALLAARHRAPPVGLGRPWRRTPDPPAGGRALWDTEADTDRVRGPLPASGTGQ